LKRLSHNLHSQGRDSAAKALFYKSLDVDRRTRRDWEVAFFEFQYSVLFEDAQDSLDALKRALALGMPKTMLAGWESALEPLRDEPEFHRIIESARVEARSNTPMNQKMTIRALLNFRQVMEVYYVDHSAYPEAQDIQGLKNAVEPVYIRSAPEADAWGNTFLVTSSAKSYTICSGGSNGGDCDLVDDGGATTDPDAAIVLRDGAFVQWPEGMHPGL
jgi:hypothetical protein